MADALARFFLRYQLAVRIGATAANLSKLLVGDPQIAPMREIIEQRADGGVLLGIRQLLDLFGGYRAEVWS